MAVPVVVSPILSTRRSSQSGNKVMAAAYTVVYSELSTGPWIFMGGDFDLSIMAAGDAIDIQVEKRLNLGTNPLRTYVTNHYVGAQPAEHLVVHLDSIINVYGVVISMRQIAGVLRTIPCEFFDSKRLGL